MILIVIRYCYTILTWSILKKMIIKWIDWRYWAIRVRFLASIFDGETIDYLLWQSLLAIVWRGLSRWWQWRWPVDRGLKKKKRKKKGKKNDGNPGRWIKGTRWTLSLSLGDAALTERCLDSLRWRFTTAPDFWGWNWA